MGDRTALDQPMLARGRHERSVRGVGDAGQQDAGGASARQDPPGRRLLTVGHGTAARDELAGLLLGGGVELVVDVRSVRGSRRLPHVRQAELEF